MKFIINPSNPQQSFGLFYNNKDNIFLKELKVIIYLADYEPFIEDYSQSCEFLMGYGDAPITHSYSINHYKRPILGKNCIVVTMVNSKYVDAVCMLEAPSTSWPVGCDYFQDIMTDLYYAGVWKSKEDRIPDYRDCVDLSTLTSIDMTLKRREGEITRTIDDWYITNKPK
jgi:hypothetical protein